MYSFVRLVSISCAFVIFTVSHSSAAAFLNLVPNGNGVFLLQGSTLVDVAGIEVNITYDTSTLSNPRVTQGGLISGALMAANPNQQGVVRIAVVKATPINGSGTIATLTFDRQGDTAGKIVDMTASLVNINGTPIPATKGFSSENSVNTSIQPATQDTSATSVISTQQSTGNIASAPLVVSGGQPVVLGSVNIASESTVSMQDKPRNEPASPTLEPQTNKEESVIVARESTSTAQNAEPSISSVEQNKKYISYKSVLQKFKEYIGEKNPKALCMLFTSFNLPGVRQEPSILLADGMVKLTVSVQIPSEGKVAPNFALRGAKLSSLRMEGENLWLIEAIPERNSLESTLTVMQSGSIIDIPLIVSPLLDQNKYRLGEFTEANFTLFLKERGTDKAPRYDINEDKIRNYIDDYIYTANYLVKQKTSNSQIKNK